MNYKTEQLVEKIFFFHDTILRVKNSNLKVRKVLWIRKNLGNLLKI